MEVENRMLIHHQGDVELRIQVSKGGQDAGKSEESRRKFWNRSRTRRSINYWQKLAQLFTVERNRRALVAAVVVMSGQILCGVNVLAFFSSTLFCSARDPNETSSDLQPLFLSWGTGWAYFLFAFPAYFLIDRKGRRWLLLTTIPALAITMLAASLSFTIPVSNAARSPVIGLFTYLFIAFYAWGFGPVPFTLSAEVFPLESRVVGMSFAVFVNLFGAGLLALFVPALTVAIGHAGLLGVFAGLNVITFFLVFFFVRETAGAAIGGKQSGSMMSVSLEELNYIFAVPTAKHAIYQTGIVLPWAWRYYILRDRSVIEPPKLYTWNSIREEERHEVPKTE